MLNTCTRECKKYQLPSLLAIASFKGSFSVALGQHLNVNIAKSLSTDKPLILQTFNLNLNQPLS